MLLVSAGDDSSRVLPVNYLAHLVLAERNQAGFLGSLLGDFVKGRLDDSYPADIQRGIRLHRKIDAFTDAHAATKGSRRRFSPGVRRFSGIVVDICYDHFLSRHWARYEAVELERFAQTVYAALTEYDGTLPPRLTTVLPRMVAENWLSAYATLTGIGRAVDGVAARVRSGERMRGAVQEVEANYAELEQDFLDFFPEVIRFSQALRSGSKAMERAPMQPG